MGTDHIKLSEADLIMVAIESTETLESLDKMGKSLKTEVSRGYTWTKDERDLAVVRSTFARQRKMLINS